VFPSTVYKRLILQDLSLLIACCTDEARRVKSGTLLCQVLAHTDHRRYAVPLTYRGEFERRPRVFAGSRQLLSEAQRGSIVRVIYLHRGEHPPLSLGDRLRVLNNDNMLTVAERKKYVRCERYLSHCNRGYFVEWQKMAD